MRPSSEELIACWGRQRMNRLIDASKHCKERERIVLMTHNEKKEKGDRRGS